MTTSEDETAIAQRKATIIAEIETALNCIPDRIAESIPIEHRERIRESANQQLAAMVRKLRRRIGADEIEDPGYRSVASVRDDLNVEPHLQVEPPPDHWPVT